MLHTKEVEREYGHSVNCDLLIPVTVDHVAPSTRLEAIECRNTIEDDSPCNVSNPTYLKHVLLSVPSGGNAGIGLEIVKSLSKLPNYQILMGCRDTNKGEHAAAGLGAPANINPIQLDVTDDESIEHAYLTIAQMFGKLDILINNAGEDVPSH